MFWFNVVEPWFLAQPMIESMFLGQPNRIKIRSLGKGVFGLLIFL
jgi:hypothetical protein